MVGETKHLIVGFLKENRGKKYSVHKLYKELNKKYSKIDIKYMTVLRNIDVLIATDKELKHERYEFARIVWYE